MHQVRSIFLSDIHLGTRACQASRLLEFLRQHEAEKIYLVGDIIDFWSMKRGVSWSSDQNTFIQKMLKRARHGVDVVFVPGNHDEVLREHVGLSFGNIRLEHETVHIAADGRRFLVLHGDIFDQATRYSRVLTVLGDHSYELLMWIQGVLSGLRHLIGIESHWSLAAFVKQRIGSAVRFIQGFEEVAAQHAAERGFDGIICGHIHAAACREIKGVQYVNCGDWVDNCSAIVEHTDGRFELKRFNGALSLNLAQVPEQSGQATPSEEPQTIAHSGRG
ncbi:MAG: UDP-2,3-diacylglucosamine diphosphatase [Gammaproteobacteria bacterium]|jgi:UDP-2,3-diacylglucosamine pyrophosphatase LpxH|nr:UDP-2,3-diacylglucosamine diphosphatase [Gammaproteobacteria bacterium]